MELVEFDVPFISFEPAVGEGRIEPNEPVWKRALSPANVYALGLGAGNLHLDMQADTPPEEPVEEVSGEEIQPDVDFDRGSPGL